MLPTWEWEPYSARAAKKTDQLRISVGSYFRGNKLLCGGTKCLSVVLGFKAFETYLLGKPFVIQTDHRVLQWLQQFKDKNRRLTCWSLALQPYTFTVTHCKGRENANADALSRIPQDPCFALQKEGRNVTE